MINGAVAMLEAIEDKMELLKICIVFDIFGYLSASMKEKLMRISLNTAINDKQAENDICKLGLSKLSGLINIIIIAARDRLCQELYWRSKISAERAKLEAINARCAEIGEPARSK